MTVETFDKYLKYLGDNNCKFLKENCILLEDNKTYLIDEDTWNDKLSSIIDNLYEGHKALILTDGCGNVVGGVLFYGMYDMQAQVFPEYKGKGYMSEIHKNGILNDNLYNNQKCSIELAVVESQEDLDMKLHLLSYIDAKISNLQTLTRWYDTSKLSDRNILKI